jgi:hypothetical protein
LNADILANPIVHSDEVGVAPVKPYSYYCWFLGIRDLSVIVD